MLPGLDLYCADPSSQPLTTAGEELDRQDHDLDHDLSDLSLSHVCKTWLGNSSQDVLRCVMIVANLPRAATLAT